MAPSPRVTHPYLELYDLERDPNELPDLANDPREAEILGCLLGQLHAWMEETHDPLLDDAVTSPFHREVLRLLSEDQHTS